MRQNIAKFNENRFPDFLKTFAGVISSKIITHKRVVSTKTVFLILFE